MGFCHGPGELSLRQRRADRLVVRCLFFCSLLPLFFVSAPVLVFACDAITGTRGRGLSVPCLCVCLELIRKTVSVFAQAVNFKER